MNQPEKRQERPRLALHLGIALTIKFAVLALLWYVLVMPNVVEIDAQSMGQRLTNAVPQSKVNM